MSKEGERKILQDWLDRTRGSDNTRLITHLLAARDEARRQLAEAERLRGDLAAELWEMRDLVGRKSDHLYEAAEAVRLLLGFVRHQHYGCDRKCNEWRNLPAWMKREIKK